MKKSSPPTGLVLKDIMLMLQFEDFNHTSLRVTDEGRLEYIRVEGTARLIDIHINGDKFPHVLKDKVSLYLSFSNQPFKKDPWIERLIGVMPSYWGSFFIGHEGHFALFLDLNIDRYEMIKAADYIIVSSRDFRRENGKSFEKPTYQQYVTESVTSVVSSVNFSYWSDTQTKPKTPTLEGILQKYPQNPTGIN